MVVVAGPSRASSEGKVALGGILVDVTTAAATDATLFYFTKKVVVTEGVPWVTALDTLVVGSKEEFPRVTPTEIPDARPKVTARVTPWLWGTLAFPN